MSRQALAGRSADHTHERAAMQIIETEVIPTELSLRLPYLKGDGSMVKSVGAVFVRLGTQDGQTAWGCTTAGVGTDEAEIIQLARNMEVCATRALDLNPLLTEYALAQLAALPEASATVLCAFDIAFHDLLGLAASLPLYRLLGGYRERIQTSITIGVAPVGETVEMARDRAAQGFRILKLKGGRSAEEDIQRTLAVHAALPNLTLRLDAEGGYDVREALEVARALDGKLEMLEQPTVASDLDGLRQVTEHSPVPILADESVTGPESALQIASQRAADGLSTKLATCGGLRCARQVDAIARAAHLSTMVGCTNEPSLLIAAGLGFALSSPNVRYGDLDGHFDLASDPTVPGFECREGWLVASERPGLGCTVNL
jgi:L-alanine-DL-glutamate epimerase-like enolase superfamily enzyme